MQQLTAENMLWGTNLPSRDCFNSIWEFAKPTLSWMDARYFTLEEKKAIFAASHIAVALHMVSPVGLDYVNCHMLPFCGHN